MVEVDIVTVVIWCFDTRAVWILTIADKLSFKEELRKTIFTETTPPTPSTARVVLKHTN